MTYAYFLYFIGVIIINYLKEEINISFLFWK